MQVPEGQEPLPTGEPATPHPTYEVVRFIEPGMRIITRQNWADAGVPDHADTIWADFNDWTIKREDLGLNDEQFDRIIRADKGLLIEERLVQE